MAHFQVLYIFGMMKGNNIESKNMRCKLCVCVCLKVCKIMLSR